VLSITLKKPGGTIYFKTDKDSLDSFCKGVLSLQHLFEKSDSPIVTIVVNEEVKYYMRNDVEIELPEAEKLIHQIKEKPILKIK
jgi:tRNA G46 methylase TrmB